MPNIVEADQSSPERTLIWDLPVRVTHWLLVAAVCGSYVTHTLGSNYFRYHVWCGYLTLLLVTARLLWGFAGTRYARFTQFLRGPAAGLRYARSLLGSDHETHAGHTPLGGWMVVVLLAGLLAQASSGLFANDQIADSGPLFGYVSSALSDRLTTWHRKLFDVLWVLIGVHVLAVLGYRLFKNEDLITPMLSGRKASENLPRSDSKVTAAIASSRVWLWLAILALLSGALYLTISNAPEASLFTF